MTQLRVPKRISVLTEWSKEFEPSTQKNASGDVRAFFNDAHRLEIA